MANGVSPRARLSSFKEALKLLWPPNVKLCRCVNLMGR